MDALQSDVEMWLEPNWVFHVIVCKWHQQVNLGLAFKMFGPQSAVARVTVTLLNCRSLKIVLVNFGKILRVQDIFSNVLAAKLLNFRVFVLTNKNKSNSCFSDYLQSPFTLPGTN